MQFILWPFVYTQGPSLLQTYQLTAIRSKRKVTFAHHTQSNTNVYGVKDSSSRTAQNKGHLYLIFSKQWQEGKHCV